MAIYRYRIEDSILYGLMDEYSLSRDEYYLLYSFYVTYSMCGSQSAKRKSFIDYGWDTNKTEDKILGKTVSTSIGNALKQVLTIKRMDPLFVFTSDNDLAPSFQNTQLCDGMLPEYDTERVVIGNTQGENKYLKLFYRIRDGLAHGKFILKLASNNEKMVLIQDDDSCKVTARILLKLNTLLAFARVVSNGHI